MCPSYRDIDAEVRSVEEQHFTDEHVFIPLSGAKLGLGRGLHMGVSLVEGRRLLVTTGFAPTTEEAQHYK